MSTQLAFDIELEPLYFPSGVEADRCRDCHRKIDGRNTRCHQGGGPEGHWVQCDACNPLGPVPR